MNDDLNIMANEVLKEFGQDAFNYFNEHVMPQLADDPYLGFDGWNCHDLCDSDDCAECQGWDGLSHRCDCGNRRVAWAWDGRFLYGEAY